MSRGWRLRRETAGVGGRDEELPGHGREKAGLASAALGLGANCAASWLGGLPNLTRTL